MNDRAPDDSLVSIVLPTYKRAHVLPSAITSVLNQTYANLELIVVDDNSPDGTREVVASFRAYFGLDRPVPAQYAHWLAGVLVEKGADVLLAPSRSGNRGGMLR